MSRVDQIAGITSPELRLRLEDYSNQNVIDLRSSEKSCMEVDSSDCGLSLVGPLLYAEELGCDGDLTLARIDFAEDSLNDFLDSTKAADPATYLGYFEISLAQSDKYELKQATISFLVGEEVLLLTYFMAFTVNRLPDRDNPLPKVYRPNDDLIAATAAEVIKLAGDDAHSSLVPALARYTLQTLLPRIEISAAQSRPVMTTAGV